MRRLHILRAALAAVTLTSWAVLRASAGSQQTEQLADQASAFIQNYCVECHNQTDKAAGLDLDSVDLSPAAAGARRDTTAWELAVRRLKARQMPPNEAARPKEEEYERVLAAMTAVLDEAANRFPNPGRTDAIRRLTRTEYENAVRDLLEVEIDAAELLPADSTGHGFDTVTARELSPTLLGRYLTAAERIARAAVGGRQRGPGGVTFRLPPDRTQEAHMPGLPLGARGGGLFKHHFAQGGEYEVRIQLARDRDEHIEGLHEAHEIDLLLDRALVKRFTVEPPKGGKGYEQQDHSRIDAHLRTRLTIEAGAHEVAVTFPRKSASLVETKRQPFDAAFNRHRHPRRSPALLEVSVAGPFNPTGPGDTQSRRRLIPTTPRNEGEAVEEAERLIRRLTRIAYRRPVAEEDVRGLMAFFERGLADGGFEAGVEAVVSAILVNPNFLLRIESEPPNATPGEPYRITQHELATRLSFFLWSSVPDEELLQAAEQQRLQDPSELRRQVQRILEDPRSNALVSSFASQWLHLPNLDSFRPDMRAFPDFDDNLRNAFRRETELLFESVIREDKSVLRLIDTDTTYLNERLAKHYGVPGVRGSRFRAVTNAREWDRGGLLRHGSVLSVTSYATRTSPTVRGHWVLKNLLGIHTPPPPPNVPALKDPTKKAATVRERLAQHRANPACASCHDLIDPVGFALENYDAVGRWRSLDAGQPIDSSGELPDGASIEDVDGLEAGILARPALFVGAVTEKLLAYALGRGVEPYDGPAVRKVVRDASAKGYRFSELIIGIVSSTPFQQRMAQ